MKSKHVFLLSLAVGAVSIFGMGTTARAQYRDSCADRIRHDQSEVDRAVDRYGYDSQQAQHERGELQRDAANCGYDYRGDRDDPRYRNGYEHRDYDRRDDRYHAAFDNGYRDGINIGQRDARQGKSFRPQKHDEYEDADRGYNHDYGDKNHYKNEYRQGFQNGYSDGYGRGR